MTIAECTHTASGHINCNTVCESKDAELGAGTRYLGVRVALWTLTDGRLGPGSSVKSSEIPAK